MEEAEEPYVMRLESSDSDDTHGDFEDFLDGILHLYLDEFTGPNAARSYANHSVWHFLIASDGEKLISNFTWCGTYSFGGWCGTDYHSLYVRSLQKKLVKFI